MYNGDFSFTFYNKKVLSAQSKPWIKQSIGVLLGDIGQKVFAIWHKQDILQGQALALFSRVKQLLTWCV